MTLPELSAAAWNKWHSNVEAHYAKKHMEMAFLAGFEAAYRTGQLVERDAVAGVLAELIRVSGSGSLALDREKDAACAAGMEVLTALKGGDHD